jgi:UDP-N-acetyl-D-galactosamine dehydrogenase
LASADFHIVTVPTPVTRSKQPDLEPLRAASRTVGRILKRGDVVVFESTVFPGATEEVCVPLLEAESGLKLGADFGVGYSPERVNPGDRLHRFETIRKVVSGSDASTLEVVAGVYESVVTAGTFRAASIKVAEAAKVIENTQRDLNIALMNELAMICDRLDLPTREVLEAAGTKWNFLPFQPGLVGGHCIGVDPYYLTAKAEAVGYRPNVILAGRQVNDSMGAFVAQKVMRHLNAGAAGARPRVGVMGLTFKENVPDLRNSKVPDVIAELQASGCETLVNDPLVDRDEARALYGIEVEPLDRLRDLDALVLAVAHAGYLENPRETLVRRIRQGGVFMDVKSRVDPAVMERHGSYCSL